jgi:flagellin-like hook-associated protein FlgL
MLNVQLLLYYNTKSALNMATINSRTISVPKVEMTPVSVSDKQYWITGFTFRDGKFTTKSETGEYLDFTDIEDVLNAYCKRARCPRANFELVDCPFNHKNGTKCAYSVVTHGHTWANHLSICHPDKYEDIITEVKAKFTQIDDTWSNDDIYHVFSYACFNKDSTLKSFSPNFTPKKKGHMEPKIVKTFSKPLLVPDMNNSAQFPTLGAKGNSTASESISYRKIISGEQNEVAPVIGSAGRLAAQIDSERKKIARAMTKLDTNIETIEKEMATLGAQLDKYKADKISGEKIKFTDFNFKLAIIEELMYIKELIQPKFDIFEFADSYEEREIDVEKEGYEPIPEAIEYFKNLEIDRKLATEITEIYQDGGNDIYINITPYWDGEDDSFNIEIYDDIKHFPNLKKMTLFNNDPKVYEDLKLKGIDAVPL